MSLAQAVLTRKASVNDVNFIFNSWLKSYRDSVKNVSDTIYYQEHHKVIETLLKTCEVFVACSEEAPDEIFGYVCAEKIDGVLVIHYAYVKHTYRNLGLCKMLLKEFDFKTDAASIYTHYTSKADKIIKKYNLVYHPYLALLKEYRK